MENLTFFHSCEFDSDLYSKWSERSSWAESDLLEYGCAYWSFKQFQRGVDYFKWIVYMVGGLIGISSSILALWTFSHREFDAVSFMYHRVINAIELPYMGLMLERAARDFMMPAFLHSYSWATFFALFSGKIDNALPTSVNIITLFISIERTIACLAPTHFSVVNRSRVVWTVVASAFVISLSLWAPSSFAHTTMYDNRTEPARYMPVWTDWGKGNGYRSYNLIRHSMTSLGAVLMIMASITAVVGLRRTAARGLRRYSSSNRMFLTAACGPHVGGRTSEYWYLLRQLSYLQLCESIPLIVLHILLVAAESIHWDYKGGGVMAPWDDSFPVAMKTLALARTKQTISVCLDVSNVAAHCFHFYWYLLFCPKVRRGFFNCVESVRHGQRPALNAIARNGPRMSIGSMDGHQTLDPQSMILRQSHSSINGTRKASSKFWSKFSSSTSGHLEVTYL